MEHVKRKILCIGVLAALLLSIACTGIVLAQPMQNGKETARVANTLSVNGAMDNSNVAVKVPIRLVRGGHGFALNGDEFHVLRVHIARAMRLQPIYANALMDENMGIEDIETETGKCTPYHRGHMRLGVNHYRLVNMSVDETGDNLIFEADVMGPVQSTDTNRIVGHICVTAMDYEGVRIGEGELTMDEGEYEGEYRVLLDLFSPRLRRWIK